MTPPDIPPMSPRERVLATIAHQPVDRLPSDLWATPEVLEKLLAHCQTQDILVLYDHLGIDGILDIAPPYIGPPLKATPDYYEDEWGMGYTRQAYQTGAYFEQSLYPLVEAQTIADLKAFSWPDPDWYDYADLRKQAARFPDRAVTCGYTAVFYYHNKLRRLEQSLTDPLLKPEFTHYLIDRISEVFHEIHRRMFEAAADGIDLTQVTDDFGSQSGLLISPKTFDTFYREPMQRAIDLAQSYNLLVFHHDDGDIRKLLPKLVEMGIHVLNPIQWRAGGWDLEWLKAEYGDQLCFHGGVDNQQTLPFGSPADVVAEVRWLKQTLGADGTGLIIAPCHAIQPNTPLDNILAMYAAVNEVTPGGCYETP